MTVAEILSIIALVERGVVNAMAIRAMQETGITDDQILAWIRKIEATPQRVRDFDLRDPAP